MSREKVLEVLEGFKNSAEELVKFESDRALKEYFNGRVEALELAIATVKVYGVNEGGD